MLIKSKNGVPIIAEYPPETIFFSVTPIKTLFVSIVFLFIEMLTLSAENAGKAPPLLIVEKGINLKLFACVRSVSSSKGAMKSFSAIITGLPEKQSQRVLPESNRALPETVLLSYVISIAYMHFSGVLLFVKRAIRLSTQ